MSTINPGKYFIHFNPVKGSVGGGYATQNQPDQPVKVAALRPDLVKWQRWVVMSGDREGQWVIVAWNDGPVSGDLLSLRDPRGFPAGPVITTSPADASDKDQNWTLEPVEIEGVSNTYVLRPVTMAVGMDYVVGDKDGEMYIENFSIRDNKPRPYWQFLASSL